MLVCVFLKYFTVLCQLHMLYSLNWDLCIDISVQFGTTWKYLWCIWS